MKKIIVTIVILSALFAVSCKKEEAVLANESKLAAILNVENERERITHRWYYFTRGGIEEVLLPQDAPQMIFRPWTECVRASGAATIADRSYFLINRAGLAVLPPSLDEEPTLKTDTLYFTDTTAGNLTAVAGNPVFHVYRNSFFNSKASENPLPFLIQYQSAADLFFPLLKVSDLGLSAQAETVHLWYDGSSWAASFKESTEERIKFTYLQFFSYEPIISLTGEATQEQLQTKELTKEAFEAVVCQYELYQSPIRLQELLAQIPSELALSVDFRSADGGTAINYWRGAEDATPYKAKAADGGSFIMAVFSDGTTYFSGALPKSPVLNGGKPIAFRLPKLPQGFVYTDFTVSGSVLYCAWEEELFYQTGRAGMIAVDLAKVLY